AIPEGRRGQRAGRDPDLPDLRRRLTGHKKPPRTTFARKRRFVTGEKSFLKVLPREPRGAVSVLRVVVRRTRPLARKDRACVQVGGESRALSLRWCFAQRSVWGSRVVVDRRGRPGRMAATPATGVLPARMPTRATLPG